MSNNLTEEDENKLMAIFCGHFWNIIQDMTRNRFLTQLGGISEEVVSKETKDVIITCIPPISGMDEPLTVDSIQSVVSEVMNRVENNLTGDDIIEWE